MRQRVTCICIAHYGVRGNVSSTFQQHACGAAAQSSDGLHIGVPFKVHPMSLTQSHQGLGQTCHAATGKPHAPFAFQVVNEAVNAGRVKWVAADQQRLDTERAAYPLVFEIVGRGVIHRAVCTKPEHGRQCFEHGHGAQKRLRTQLFIPFFKQFF